MSICRSLDEVIAAARLAGADDPPLSQAQADLVWALTAPLRVSPAKAA